MAREESQMKKSILDTRNTWMVTAAYENKVSKHVLNEVLLWFSNVDNSDSIWSHYKDRKQIKHE